MTSPFPSFQFLIAFNNGPFDDPTAITTVAPVGTVGAANVWTDITDHVRTDDGVRGKQHELNQFEAGTRKWVLGNDDGRFNPWNTSGPYYGLLKVGIPVQVRVTVGGTIYYRFTGLMDSLKPLWPDVASQEAELHATDAFRWFQKADITSQRYSTQVLADGATDYLRLSDVVGSTQAANAVSGRMAGTPNSITFGGAGAMPADIASSAQFGTANSGGYNGYVQLAQPPGSLGGSALISVDAWVSSKNWNPSIGFFNNIYTVADNGSGNFSFAIDNNGAVALLYGDDTGTSMFFETVAHLPADGTWHHVAVVVNGASPGVAIFIDGVSQTMTGSWVALASWTPLYANIGGSAGYSQPPTAQFPGSMQEVAVYRGVCLTSTQVASHYIKGAFPVQSTGARIGAVLDAGGWPTAARSIDTGTSNCQAQTSSLVTTTMLAHMQDCELTEAGALFMDGRGRVKFVSRTTLFTNSLYQSSQATFGDNPGEIKFLPGPDMSLDDLNTYNQATAQRVGGVRQVWPTAAPSAPSTWQPSGNLLGTSDAEVLNRLQYVVNQFSSSALRLNSITVDMVDAIGDGLTATVLALDMQYRVTANRHQMGLAEVAVIQQITEHYDKDNWTIGFALDPADLTTYFVWGTSTWGQTTTWAF